ncbi:MAG: hypothetical protein JWQ91_1620 [Aeromicrobium sp.]|jgi:hypothetical protein|uniref:hypothetical protein n=1 Tax=Aeromicrobium sp. TaxID=1871063 RepID=UPI002607F7F6|nr:hypothetical protein [Aeromicrobium sp.]MCW2789356.1 hypothetical protein [Aeromicrobium sp.]MCW2824703.1 hypothetical protein [Aeromicrobium sp.]
MISSRVAWALGLLTFGLVITAVLTSTSTPAAAKGRVYPQHTGIVATTFWVGEIFDPDAEDGSQMLSTYDDNWYRSYGGCDGREVKGDCRTEKRVASNDYFPSSMTPKENPFYLDLPFDDVNDSIGAKTRKQVVPWIQAKPWSTLAKDADSSVMKNRWVKISRKGHTCYGQIQDAGPGKYHDAKYVFGSDDSRPANKRYNKAGMDVSPALNGCLRFSELNGESDKVSWRFVDGVDVPAGPWRRVITR